MGTDRTPRQSKDDTIDDTILELLTPWAGAWGGQTYVIDYEIVGQVLWAVREREEVDLAKRPYTGYDYRAQAWVKDGLFEPCGHPRNRESCCHVPALAGTRSDATYEVPAKRWITCCLLNSGGGYTTQSEDMGPHEVSCPLHFLDLVPDPEIGYSTSWRERVRAEAVR